MKMGGVLHEYVCLSISTVEPDLPGELLHWSLIGDRSTGAGIRYLLRLVLTAASSDRDRDMQNESCRAMSVRSCSLSYSIRVP